jgi:hypothetical protein
MRISQRGNIEEVAVRNKVVLVVLIIIFLLAGWSEVQSRKTIRKLKEQIAEHMLHEKIYRDQLALRKGEKLYAEKTMRDWNVGAWSAELLDHWIDSTTAADSL